VSISVTSATVEKTVVDALLQLGVEPCTISPDATFEELDLDSLDLAELSQIIEEEHGIRLTGGDVKEIKSVGAIVNLVVSRAG
jgi:acyl carrier protein